MKSLIAIIVLIIISVFALLKLNIVSDHIYYLTNNPSEKTLCEGGHFYQVAKPLSRIQDQIALIYSYDIKASETSEYYFHRMEDKLDLSNYIRYPAALDYTSEGAALWGEVLTRTEFDAKNPDLISASYEYFLNKNDQSKAKFDNELLKINIIPKIFHQTLIEVDYVKALENHSEIIRQSNLRSVPAIIVHGKYIVYPDHFKDGRKPWIIAEYLSKKGDQAQFQTCKT